MSPPKRESQFFLIPIECQSLSTRGQRIGGLLAKVATQRWIGLRVWLYSTHKKITRGDGEEGGKNLRKQKESQMFAGFVVMIYFLSLSLLYGTVFFEFFFSSCTLGWIVGDLNTVCLDFCRT